ncbi:ankyrin repeat [Fusarium albosuccineum]|uniref:Ankyrin repeat n=1 Tax=Fusarium albosuccineum TaxID=1237068 RepID=A0A8H4KMT6_9HYPO|nr:ankyrin repeat [Fusarium albosuccineum]
MAPIGVITIIVSAIRVAGPRWLKAVIGRARENVATAELEVMSSTSSEACELWNSQTRAVVRCPGTTDNCEFICVYPTSMTDGKDGEKNLSTIRIMEIKNAMALKDEEASHLPRYLQKLDSERNRSRRSSSTIPPNTIIIIRNTGQHAPNMTLNCSADGKRWQIRACAAIGIVIQAGVLIFFGFLTEYRTLRFDKDGSPIESYAMPMAVVGTVALALGILVCAHAVDKSSTEEIYEVIGESDAVAMVWLQKQKKVSEQHFDSAAIYPTMKRYRAYTSKRAIDSDGNRETNTSITVPHPLNSDWWLKVKSTIGLRLKSTMGLKVMSTTGTIISLLGFFVQFAGLRGMHWLATIVQLGAVIIMTILRAVIRRHLALGLASNDLDDSTGFELEWFVTSLLDSKIHWLPEEPFKEHPGEKEQTKTKLSRFTWIIQTGDSKGFRKPNPSNGDNASTPRSYHDVSELWKPQNILDLRRHLGDLSKWQGSASTEALAVAKAIERAMNFIMPYAGNNGTDNTGKSGTAVKDFTWTVKVDCSLGQSGSTQNQTEGTNGIEMNVKYSPSDGWRAAVDEIDAALSLWLYSVKERQSRDNRDPEFPSGNDYWIRGGPVQQQRCLQIIGPVTALLLRDLEWWMPNGLDGVLAAHMQRQTGSREEFPHTVRRERIGHSGERLPISDENDTPVKDTSLANDLTDASRDSQDDNLTYWDWNPAADVHLQNIKRMQDEDNESEDDNSEVSDSEGYDSEDYYSEDESEDDESEADQENQRPRVPKPYNLLVVELQDSLHKLYAKELFSAFLWALANHLDESESMISRKLQANIQSRSVTGPEAWKDFSLENQQLARFVQSISELGLWTEREAWLSIIPPLSATDNLPGLEAVIDLAQKNAVMPERDLAWGQAGSAYRWLFDIGMSSSPTSHICVKSTAILWRFHQRLSSSDSLHVDKAYHSRGFGLEHELAKTKRRLGRQREQNESLQDRLNYFFNLHQHLESSVEETTVAPNEKVPKEFAYFWYTETPKRSVYRILKSAGDIFDRTKLHHAMRSKFIDHKEISSQHKKSQWKGLSVWKYGPEIRQDYERCIDQSMAEVKDLGLYPMRLLDDIHSTIFFPFQTFEILLANGADPNARDLDHWTPLHYACQLLRLDSATYTETGEYYEDRDKMRVRTLIRNKAYPNAQGLDGNTPLHCAAMSGRLHLVSLLVSRGGDVKIANYEGRTPLHLAAMGDSAKMISLLLDLGSDIEAQDQARRTPLHLATIAEKMVSIETLIGRKADLTATDNNDSTPLYLVMMKLAKLKANPATKDNDKAAIPYLSALRNSEVIKVLRDQDVLWLSIRIAIRNNEINIISLLMDSMDEDSWPPRNDNNETPFHFAVVSGNSEAIFKMMEKVSQLKFKPESILEKIEHSGFTALSLAVWEGGLNVLKTIIANSPPGVLERLLEIGDKNGYTALFWAVKHVQAEIFSLLADRGANIRTKSNRDSNLLHASARQNSWITETVIKKIKETGGDSQLKAMLQEKDEEGRTPLDKAEYGDNKGNVKLLSRELERLKEVATST